MKKHGIVHKDFKNGRRLTTVYNKGHVMNSYRYPIIDVKFHSDLVSYDNLHLCNGWFFEDKSENSLAVTRVLECKKPMGESFFWKHEEAEDRDNFIKSNYSHVKSRVSKGHHTFFVTVAMDECLGNLLDMRYLIHDYDQFFARAGFDTDFRCAIEGHLKMMGDKKVTEYFTYDFANPDGPFDLITTGLILGYPIETTASLIIRDYLEG